MNETKSGKRAARIHLKCFILHQVTKETKIAALRVNESLMGGGHLASVVNNFLMFKLGQLRGICIIRQNTETKFEVQENIKLHVGARIILCLWCRYLNNADCPSCGYFEIRGSTSVLACENVDR